MKECTRSSRVNKSKFKSQKSKQLLFRCHPACPDVYREACRRTKLLNHNYGTPRKLMDVTKLTALGWKAKIGLREGIERVYEEYKNRQVKI